ncbi:unnamed protein product [Nippostrongylus brasiliensis]|uniref:Glycogen [starch] synthase n=1 Tax=Nippostrongylus brasiliensis TaxID=27835 RepID=A0A0N4YJ01_NIPBR|nr:unnamed protein product [Nippostrongylus brasiliensis]
MLEVKGKMWNANTTFENDVAAECIVIGVPSVTTNLSGFGCFINQHVEDAKSDGIHVVDRSFEGCNGFVNEGAEILYEYTCLSGRHSIIARNCTDSLSELLDWKTLSEKRLAKASLVPATPSISCPTTSHESDYSENSELDD